VPSRKRFAICASLTIILDGNCALLFNLTFCDEVAYAVPSNPNTYPSIENLGSLYDNYSQTAYQNFSYTLELMACNTTSAAKYSLSKDCDDCAAAYKQWVCAVTIPRCQDYSSQDPWLQPRNMGQGFYNNASMLSSSLLQQQYNPMPSAPGNSIAQQQTFISSFATNSSRNPTIIDEIIMPGPYKEVLPCEDLCYSLVQSCPAMLGFGCPYPGRGLEASYGIRNDAGIITCSYLGAVYYLNDGAVIGRSLSMLSMTFMSIIVSYWLG
jgi:calcium channel MID1